MSHLGWASGVAVVRAGDWRSHGKYISRDAKCTDGKWRTQLQHRFVVEIRLGRPLSTDEHVHHRDENKTNNDPENLEVLSKADHCREHFGTGRTFVERDCSCCGTRFDVELKRSNEAKKRGRELFCSRSCASRDAGIASGAARRVAQLSHTGQKARLGALSEGQTSAQLGGQKAAGVAPRGHQAIPRRGVLACDAELPRAESTDLAGSVVAGSGAVDPAGRQSDQRGVPTLHLVRVKGEVATAGETAPIQALGGRGAS